MSEIIELKHHPIEIHDEAALKQLQLSVSAVMEIPTEDLEEMRYVECDAYEILCEAYDKIGEKLNEIESYRQAQQAMCDLIENGRIRP